MSDSRAVPATIPTVCARLLAMADSGYEFVRHQLLLGSPCEQERSGDVVGRGFYLTRLVPFPGSPNTPTIYGRLHLQVMRLDYFDSRGTLFVQQRLEWALPGSSTHCVSTTINLSNESVDRLAHLEPYPPVFRRLLPHDYDADTWPAVSANFLAEQYLEYGAFWENEHRNSRNRPLPAEPYLPLVKAMRIYNPRTFSLINVEPVAAVEPDMIISLYDWLSTQTETYLYLPERERHAQ